MDGVVRAPSAFSITLVELPSMMDTQLLVVPRSMPMIFPMLFSVNAQKRLNALKLRLRGGFSSRAQGFIWAR